MADNKYTAGAAVVSTTSGDKVLANLTGGGGGEDFSSRMYFSRYYFVCTVELIRVLVLLQ